MGFPSASCFGLGGPSPAPASSRSARTAVALALLSAVLTFVLPASPPRALAAGSPPLTGMRGEHLNDADLAAGYSVIVIWASWSPRSRGVVERVNQLAERWGGKARVVTVDFEEDRSAIDAFLAGKALQVPVFLDSDGLFSKHYSITTLPALLVIKDGEATHHGRLPDDPTPLLTGLIK